jgi:hypothetical protein
MAYPTAYTSTVAVPLPSEQTVQQMIGESYDPERTLNVLKMFAGTEDLFEATIGIVKAMFQAKGIDPRTREMIILRIDAAASDGPVSGINPEYVLVCNATDELSKSGTLRDETLRELLNRYGETISRKIVLMIGWFNMLSLFLNGCRVPLETTDKVGTRTSPLG